MNINVKNEAISSFMQLTRHGKLSEKYEYKALDLFESRQLSAGYSNGFAWLYEVDGG